MRANGDTIRTLREERGLPLRGFARRVQVSPAQLSRIERSQSNPRPDLLKRIAEGLGVRITTIACHHEPEEPVHD
ncbi:helix-turn-helix domain-containing protein [Streptomyces indicus]|uniref:helix-turn-helix domain-containing protein n=1 Tax=Streptomyces indicus TaxID=417292 RepID=UPI000B8788B7|nr:helix-turn-helix transcriptional regulator [Streptomyces indicus]